MIYEATPKNWKQLMSVAGSLPGFVFRGQNSYAWDMSTNIERLALRFHFGVVQGLTANRELWILTQFRRRAHNLIEKPPEYDNLIEWLALIQHHGGPTRLLDFTHSFFVGLLFACEGAHEDAALWLIDYHNLLDSHEKHEPNKSIYHQQIAILDKATKLIGKKTTQIGILPIEPERLSERMSIQQGLSIMPINLDKTFMENLSTQYGWEEIKYEKIKLDDFMGVLYSIKPRVAKIQIKLEWLPDILLFLDKMNINTNTLFPGLDGFARSLRIYLMLPTPPKPLKV